MAELDYNYIGKLVEYARGGDSDAFAELYAATYQKQFQFSYSYTDDEFLAKSALQETYITALKNLPTLEDPKLFISWLNQINFRICYDMSFKQAKADGEVANSANSDLGRASEGKSALIGGKSYVLHQVMALPYSECQSIFLRYFRNMKISDISEILEMSKSAVRSCISSGKKRLGQMTARQEM